MNSEMPFLVTPHSATDAVGWAEKNLGELEGLIDTYGAVLLRGFVAPSEMSFRNFVDTCCGGALKYLYRSTPRTDLGGNIFTATEYPPGLQIPFHNENSFQRDWPLLLFFFCEVPALTGGLTPLVDTEKVTRRIPAEIRRKYFRKGVTYIRNYSQSVDLPWQVVFQTESRDEVERFCGRNDIEYEWIHTDNLRTRQTCQSFARNPRTQVPVWFNQAHLFHPSSLDERSRELLREMFSLDAYPRNATHGDGSSLDENDLMQIRDAYNQEEIRFQWRQGDILVLDNMRFAHSRSPYKGKRRILAAMGRPATSIKVDPIFIAEID